MTTQYHLKTIRKIETMPRDYMLIVLSMLIVLRLVQGL